MNLIRNVCNTYVGKISKIKSCTLSSTEFVNSFLRLASWRKSLRRYVYFSLSETMQRRDVWSIGY